MADSKESMPIGNCIMIRSLDGMYLDKVIKDRLLMNPLVWGSDIQ